MGSREGGWREGGFWLLDAPVHSATAQGAGGVECGAGPGARLDAAVWALGIPFPTLLLLGMGGGLHRAGRTLGII